MGNIQADIQQLVDDFVVQISDLARRAAIDTLAGALGGGLLKQAVRGRGSATGAKRSGADLDNLADSFLAFVTKSPGLRIEQINKKLGTRTKELALPIRKLIADGSIKTKGSRRSTMYFAGKS